MTLLPYKWWETLFFTCLTIDIGQFQEGRNENLEFFECNIINIAIDTELEEIVLTAQNICLISVILAGVFDSILLIHFKG